MCLPPPWAVLAMTVGLEDSVRVPVSVLGSTAAASTSSGVLMSHPVLEGKPNANHVRARIRTHVHIDYIIGHHHTMLELNSGKVLSYIKMSETSTESIT